MCLLGLDELATCMRVAPGVNDAPVAALLEARIGARGVAQEHAFEITQMGIDAAVFSSQRPVKDVVGTVVQAGVEPSVAIDRPRRSLPPSRVQTRFCNFTISSSVKAPRVSRRTRVSSPSRIDCRSNVRHISSKNGSTTRAE